MTHNNELLESIQHSMERDEANRQELIASKDFLKYTEGLSNTTELLKKVAEMKDLELILQVESVLVHQERQHIARKDKSSIPSLNDAVEDFDTIERVFKILKSPSTYKDATSGYGIRQRINGIPIDGFHHAVKSHILRLGNRVKTVGVLVPEKNLVKQRQANMRIAKELYIALQCKAVGIDQPTKKKRFER